MKGRDEIKDLFSDKLGNFEAQVRPDMWANIASQIGGTTSVVASTGLSLLSKTFIGLGIGAAVITTVLLVTPSNKPIDKKENITTSNTNSPTEKEVLDEQIIKEESSKTISPSEFPNTKQEEKNSPAPLVNKEINQDQNFRTDISLIDVKKDKPISWTSVDKKEESKTDSEATDKLKVGGLKIDKEKLKEIEKKEEKQPEAPKPTYSIEKLPNVFTPNGDGNNDFLSITSEGLLDFNVVVFDNKQTVVFESTNPDFKWDGTDKGGNKVKAGTYGYYIIAQDSNGNKVNKFTSLQVVF